MCSTLVLLILATTTTSVLGAKYIFVNLDDYNSCYPLLVRPHVTTSVPSQTIQLYGESFQATRHHIIPFSTLSAFFNVVLREDVTRPLGQYLAGRVREIYNFFGENEHLGAFPPGREPVLLYTNDPNANGRDPFEVDSRMVAAFTWMPGNLFYGPPPNRRSNDPGMGIEENAEQIVGSGAFSVLRRIYDNMQNYTNNPDHRTTRMFDEIMNDLTQIDSERSRPYEFIESDWVVTGVKRGKRLFDIKGSSVTIEEIPDDEHDELRRRSVGSAIQPEDYMNAADQVCEVFGSHLVPKINKKYTHVDINSDVSVLFLYKINDNHFVYGQNENTKRWFIMKVNQDGTVGSTKDGGSWQNFYGVQVPFNIDGKQYFYGHNLESHYWFIQELKADGTMGRETSNGHFAYSYKTVFHVQIAGQHYLYGHNEPNKNWFLQILKSDGTLGSEVSHGFWDHYYNIQFPFKIGNKQYFCGLNTDLRRHFIREIAPDLIPSMGKPYVYTTLDHSYSVFLTVEFGSKTYIFEYDPNNQYSDIREVFGDIVYGHEYTDYELTNAHPFNINGYQYFYAQLKPTLQWVVLHFDFTYVIR